jgi:hypothetical protein
MTSKQWQGIYAALAAFLLLVFLHSPWSGYETTWYVQFTNSMGNLPLWEWHTIEPILPWLGSLKNLAASTVFIALLGAVWIVANRPASKGTPPSDA